MRVTQRKSVNIIRNAIISVLVFVLTCCGSACSRRGVSRTPVLGYVADANAEADRLVAFRQRLKELGYVEGSNIVIEFRLADSPSDYPKLVADLVGKPVDILLAGNAAATRAAHHVTRTVPIVMAAVNDPVGLGVVNSLERPGTNFTGARESCEDSSTRARAELFTSIRIYTHDRDEAERLLAVPRMSESWRRWAHDLLQKAKGRPTAVAEPGCC